MADFTGGPGLAAFLATFAMVGAAILLFRSLGKHLRKVRTHPPESDDATRRRPDEPAGSDDPGSSERG